MQDDNDEEQTCSETDRTAHSPQENGQTSPRALCIDDHCLVKGTKNIWALGDAAFNGLAPTAQVAGQEVCEMHDLKYRILCALQARRILHTLGLILIASRSLARSLIWTLSHAACSPALHFSTQGKYLGRLFRYGADAMYKDKLEGTHKVGIRW